MILFLSILAALIILILLTAFVCFYLAFYSPKRKKTPREEYPLPHGKIYEPFRDTIIAWTKEARRMPHEDVSILSYDGLCLRGKYYEYAPDAPIELMIPGYRGLAERDLSGGVQRCFSLGRSALMVEPRACGGSDGHVITFGIRERRDCVAWANYLFRRFGADRKIILTGISMGAATVLMASAMDLPKNVVGVIADCGYDSPKRIIQHVIGQMGLPARLLYPFVKLGARLYGGFNPEEASPLEAMTHCRLPVFFVHGTEDDFVPCQMSRNNFHACTSPKKLLEVPRAGHGMSYLIAPEDYKIALREIWKESMDPH